MTDLNLKGKLPYKFLLFSLLLILIDQGIKLWMFYDVVPNHYGEIDLIPDFFKLHYVENKGMAFGMELGGDYGKLILTTFRLGAMVGICLYLVHLASKNAHDGLLWSIAAVLGGAIGNVIDSTFYGVFLKNSPIEASTPWFHGQVIDMFYAYGLDGQYPDWIPFLGGEYNTMPIFNFADACIFCGVVSILLFQRSFFEFEEKKQNPKNEIIEENSGFEQENRILVEDENLLETDDLKTETNPKTTLNFDENNSDFPQKNN